MKRGFYTIMTAQFFSSLADNALFALFYVVLAPFVGAFADAYPKGRVMFISNAIKVIGCMLMFSGGHPLLAYAVVGLGAAAYSPAKYGILTELLPPSQLVKANGWIEGLTIASIILGVVLGGLLVGPIVSPWLMGLHIPGVSSAAQAAIGSMVLVYALAAWFNTRIPLTGVSLHPMPRNWLVLLRDFGRCNRVLWKDRLGQISLATTTLFWGVSGNLRYIVLAWAAAALGYSTSQASGLVGVVAIGTAAGAVAASIHMRLDKATRVMPLGVAMGLLVVLMNWIDQFWLAAPFLILLGAIGGFLVVPMNALLQHRGHMLMGAGRSIAVQNFNEQAAILALGLGYSLATGAGLSAFAAITAFGALVASIMWAIQRWHRHNQRVHGEELAVMLRLTRDPHETRAHG
jgi:MFS transporter, LPLT family, lysophospholipid transporter